MQRVSTIWKVLCSTILFAMTNSAWADWTLNMSKGVTPISKDIYDLHMIIMWICVWIGVLVFGVMIYSMIKHRKSRGHKAAEFHEHPSLEIVWAIVPFIILVIMAIPATKVLIRMEDTAKAGVTVKVTGYQWKWRYDYLDQGFGFFSNLATPPEQTNNQQKKDKWYLLDVDNPLVIPVDTKVRFLVTSNDVVHSWWVPDLGIKRDAMPGFVYEAWARVERPGTYRGQCAELCGVHHGFMPIVVKAVSKEDFKTWVGKQKQQQDEAKAAAESKTWTFKELMTLGKTVYEKNCAACHKLDGTGQPPVFPAMRGSSIAVGKPISRHIELVLNGVPGTAMQSFASQLTDTDIAAVVTYERNAWENNTGDVVQPLEVKKLRNN